MYRKLPTCCKSMASVQTHADSRLVCDQVNDLFQFRELPTDSITLTTHVLDYYSKHANDRSEQDSIKINKYSNN